MNRQTFFIQKRVFSGMTIHNSAYFINAKGAKDSQPVFLEISVFIHRFVIPSCSLHIQEYPYLF